MGGGQRFRRRLSAVDAQRRWQYIVLDKSMHLDDVPIAQPCPPEVGAADFEPAGPDNVYCKVCKKHVYDLSAMTESEATAFLKLNAEAGPCVAYRANVSGHVVHVSDDCLRRRSPAAVLLGASALLAACNTTEEPLTGGPEGPPATAEAPMPADLPTDLPTMRGRLQPGRLLNTDPECKVPYVIDENGIKKPKHECLSGVPDK